MKAEWSDVTEKTACLCCGQRMRPGLRRIVTPATAQREFEALERLGYTRESLLTKHLEQVQYQLPGLASWLISQ